VVVLSLFPGIDLLGRAFEAGGFCVVRGPDRLWGGDIREFSPPPGVFWGIIGGPPCQDFSAARRSEATGEGLELLAEFERVTLQAAPEWWLLENVPRVPDVRIEGYSWQRLDLDQGWFSGVSGLRHIQFGSRSGVFLDVPAGRKVRGAEPRAMASDGRTFAELCRVQGLPGELDLPGFTIEAAKRAIGNAVPWCLGRELCRAVAAGYGVSGSARASFDPAACDRRRCACGCGRTVSEFATYSGPACRKRAQRARDKEAGIVR